MYQMFFKKGFVFLYRLPKITAKILSVFLTLVLLSQSAGAAVVLAVDTLEYGDSPKIRYVSYSELLEALENDSGTDYTQRSYQAVRAAVYKGASMAMQRDDAGVAVVGNMPFGSKAIAYPVTAAVDGADVVAGYVIRLFDHYGNEVMPDEGEEFGVCVNDPSRVGIHFSGEGGAAVFSVADSTDVNECNCYQQDGVLSFVTDRLGKFAFAKDDSAVDNAVSPFTLDGSDTLAYDAVNALTYDSSRARTTVDVHWTWDDDDTSGHGVTLQLYMDGKPVPGAVYTTSSNSESSHSFNVNFLTDYQDSSEGLDVDHGYPRARYAEYTVVITTDDGYSSTYSLTKTNYDEDPSHAYFVELAPEKGAASRKQINLLRDGQRLIILDTDNGQILAEKSIEYGHEIRYSNGTYNSIITRGDVTINGVTYRQYIPTSTLESALSGNSEKNNCMWQFSGVMPAFQSDRPGLAAGLYDTVTAGVQNEKSKNLLCLWYKQVYKEIEGVSGSFENISEFYDYCLENDFPMSSDSQKQLYYPSHPEIWIKDVPFFTTSGRSEALRSFVNKVAYSKLRFSLGFTSVFAPGGAYPGAPDDRTYIKSFERADNSTVGSGDAADLRFFIEQKPITSYSIEIKNTGVITGEIADENKVAHKKSIDFLGDAIYTGFENPDTSLDGDSVNGVNYTTDLSDFYRLYLTVGGNYTPMDVMIICDVTTSMNDMYGFYNGTAETRYDTTNRLVAAEGGLIEQIYQANPDNKVALVTFAGATRDRHKFRGYAMGYGDFDINITSGSTVLDTHPAKEYVSQVLMNWWDNSDYENHKREDGTVEFENYKRDIANNYVATNEHATKIDNTFNNNGGTIYAAGFLRAAEVMSEPEIRDDGHKKLIIFLTDGYPNAVLASYNSSINAYEYDPDGTFIQYKRQDADKLEKWQHADRSYMYTMAEYVGSDETSATSYRKRIKISDVEADSVVSFYFRTTADMDYIKLQFEADSVYGTYVLGDGAVANYYGSNNLEDNSVYVGNGWYYVEIKAPDAAALGADKKTFNLYAANRDGSNKIPMPNDSCYIYDLRMNGEPVSSDKVPSSYTTGRDEMNTAYELPVTHNSGEDYRNRGRITGLKEGDIVTFKMQVNEYDNVSGNGNIVDSTLRLYFRQASDNTSAIYMDGNRNTGKSMSSSNVIYSSSPLTTKLGDGWYEVKCYIPKDGDYRIQFVTSDDTTYKLEEGYIADVTVNGRQISPDRIRSYDGSSALKIETVAGDLTGETDFNYYAFTADGELRGWLDKNNFDKYYFLESGTLRSDYKADAYDSGDKTEYREKVEDLYYYANGLPIPYEDGTVDTNTVRDKLSQEQVNECEMQAWDDFVDMLADPNGANLQEGSYKVYAIGIMDDKDDTNMNVLNYISSTRDYEVVLHEDFDTAMSDAEFQEAFVTTDKHTSANGKWSSDSNSRVQFGLTPSLAEGMGADGSTALELSFNEGEAGERRQIYIAYKDVGSGQNYLSFDLIVPNDGYTYNLENVYSPKTTSSSYRRSTYYSVNGGSSWSSSAYSWSNLETIASSNSERIIRFWARISSDSSGYLALEFSTNDTDGNAKLYLDNLLIGSSSSSPAPVNGEVLDLDFESGFLWADNMQGPLQSKNGLISGQYTAEFADNPNHMKYAQAASPDGGGGYSLKCTPGKGRYYAEYYLGFQHAGGNDHLEFDIWVPDTYGEGNSNVSQFRNIYYNGRAMGYTLSVKGGAELSKNESGYYIIDSAAKGRWLTLVMDEFGTGGTADGTIKFSMYISRGADGTDANCFYIDNVNILSADSNAASEEDNERAMLAANSDELRNSIKTILDAETTSGFVITDTLSSYVELYTDQPDLKVVLRKNSIHPHKYEDTVIWQSSGACGSSGVVGGAVDGHDEVDSVTYIPDSDPSGNRSTGRIVLRMNPNYRTDGSETVILSYNVKLTETAKDEFETDAVTSTWTGTVGDTTVTQLYNNSSDYPYFDSEKTAANQMKGDPDTDLIYLYHAEGDPEGLMTARTRVENGTVIETALNPTSSNQPGLFSNLIATVQYNYEGRAFRDTYAKPVVQVRAAKGFALRKEKEWGENPSAFVNLAGAEFKLIKLKFAEGSDTHSEIVNGITVVNTAFLDSFFSPDNAERWSDLIPVCSDPENAALYGACNRLITSDSGGILLFLEEGYQSSPIADNEAVVDNEIYMLVETRAPDGYCVTSQVWYIWFRDNGFAEFVSKYGHDAGANAIDYPMIIGSANSVYVDGQELPEGAVKDAYLTQNVTVPGNADSWTRLLPNTMVYNLPSSGSAGTYLFTLGGVALMTAACIVNVRSRRKEELKAE